jgi:hypothetical protein
MSRIATILVSAALIVLAAGCASRNTRVRCDAHLQPINSSTVATARAPDPVTGGLPGATAIQGSTP